MHYVKLVQVAETFDNLHDQELDLVLFKSFLYLKLERFREGSAAYKLHHKVETLFAHEAIFELTVRAVPLLL